MTADDREQAPAPAAGITRRQIAGETILVPVSGDLARLQEIFVLDDVADHIWQRIDGRTTVEEIVDSVTESFDVDRDTARRDLLAFMEALESAGLVEGPSSGDSTSE